MTDPFRLERFVAAQAPVLDDVVRELKAGRKTGHWMWFVFPQLAGLGRSETARFYALASLAEARAYVDHPTLGARLRDCTELVLASGAPVSCIFGAPDDLKFHSCMTLFAHAAPGEPLFTRALRDCFGGAEDAATVRLLSGTD